MERLQRILAARGVASRRAAEALITAGRVSVDGEVVTALGTKVDPVHAQIRVDGKLLRTQRPRYLILNKPRGYITTTKDERDRRTVMDIVQVSERVYPVGRLDRDTEGLLLLTNDGDVANRVMHPRYELDKEYHILTLARPTETVLQRVRNGVVVAGHRAVPEEFRILRQTPDGLILKLVIHEGTYHLVRNVMDTVGIPVERLRRVRVGPLSVAGLPLGAWRDLTAGEQNTLFEAIHLDRDAVESVAKKTAGRREARAGRPRTRKTQTQGAAATVPSERAAASASIAQQASPAGQDPNRDRPRTSGRRSRGVDNASRRTESRDRPPEQRLRSGDDGSGHPSRAPAKRAGDDRPPRRRGEQRDQQGPRRQSRRPSSPRGNDEQFARPPRGRGSDERRGSPPRDRDRRPGGSRQDDRRPRPGRPPRRDVP
ncbi:MAG TPA: pseudouridine synthase [Thermomicrobiales bacterium]